MIENKKIAIIGLGYVGLPLAIEFAKKYPVIGFDINRQRVDELRNNIDKTLEVTSEQLAAAIGSLSSAFLSKGFFPTTDIAELRSCNIFIITVPTPTDQHHRPVLTPLIKASESVGSVLKKGDFVIYESTVYPGVTEDECVPVLERVSGLICNKDFFAGYSPERINPGDKEHTVANILKVTSGSTPEAADLIDQLYRSIIVAGTFKASSIKVAEAAKVIENSQRDINIAFVNELSKIFNLIGIDTNEVLEAAGTKWNFLKFKPGLVGGHCIGVDPYYLAQKAQELGYHPEIILAGRRLNDGMGAYIARELVRLMILKNIPIQESHILILGITFKENCPDIRNTRVVDIYEELRKYNIKVEVYDPRADIEEVKNEYAIDMLTSLSGNEKKYQGLVLAVAHKEFSILNLDSLLATTSVVYDVKGILPMEKTDARL